jgi:acetyltransferase-like isoleucine patch superfamily enzyme
LVGPLRIKGGRKGRLAIGDDVCIYSHPVANPLIGRRESVLWAMAPDAVLEIGDRVGCSSVCICAASEIRIGSDTIIGADAMIFDNDFHQPGPRATWENAHPGTARPVRIGRGCFIGTRAIILKGVIIGDGAVVGAGAVVTRDVPAGHLASGNPAEVKPLPAKWKREHADVSTTLDSD